MENCEMFDDIALSKLWICKEHHSSVDVLEINIGLQKRCIHDLWTNNMQAFPLTHLWRIKKKVEGLLINEFRNHESIDYSWMYTKVTGISIQEMDNTY